MAAGLDATVRRQGEEYTYICHVAKQQPCSQELQPVGQQLLPQTTAFAYLSPTNATVQACIMHALQAANRLLAVLLILHDFELGK